MKLNDLLNEGMEFGTCKLETREDGTRVFSDPSSRQEEQNCPFCESGKQTYGDDTYDCEYCKGSGKTMEWVSDSPEMQVSNANGMAIQRDILGLEKPDYGGSIPPEKLPELRKKLFRMVNIDKDRESMHQAPTDQQGKVSVSHQGNVATIRRGARMISPGRSDDQVLSYAQRLLELVDYAIKNNLYVAWA